MEKLMKVSRPSEEQMKEMESLTKTVTQLESSFRKANEARTKDTERTERIEKNRKARLAGGRNVMDPEACAKLMADGMGGGNVHSLGGDVWYFDVNGSGNLKARWNVTNNKWETAKADDIGDEDLTWHDVSDGLYLGNSYFRESGRRQVNRLVDRLSQIHTEFPIT